MDLTRKEPEVYVLVTNGDADLLSRRKTVKRFFLGEIVYHEFSQSPYLIGVTTKDKLKADTEAFSREDDGPWLLPHAYLLAFPKDFEQYVLPVVPRKDRVTLLKDRSLCRKLTEIKENDVVLLLSEKLRTSQCARLSYDKPARVKYIGPIPELDPGIHFGVELLMPEEGDVISDVIGHSGFGEYFTCRPYSGLIVTANHILPDYDRSTTYLYFLDQSMERKNSHSSLPFKSSPVEETRAEFRSMPQYSHCGSHAMEHTDQLDPYRQKRELTASTAFSTLTRPEDSCSSGKTRTFSRTEMDRTVPTPVCHNKHLSKEAKRRDFNCLSTDYSARNGSAFSHHEKDYKQISNDQSYKKDKKLDSAPGDYSSSYPNSSYTSNGKNIPVSKLNGSVNPHSSNYNDTVDGYKVKNTARPVRFNNNLHGDKAVVMSSRMRDDVLEDFKPHKVNNTAATASLHSPGYLSASHNSLNDPIGNHLPSASYSDHNLYYGPEVSSPSPDSSSELEVGSLVEVEYGKKTYHGVIRWIGELHDKKSRKRSAGIELDTPLEGAEAVSSDGRYGGTPYFTCHPRRGIFVNLNKCKKDPRFLENCSSADAMSKSFGHGDCPKIEGIVPPIMVHRDVHKICGKPKGIQGHHNSCYLDATLFSMFTFTSVFDSLLYRPKEEKKDRPQYNDVQSVLRDEIVNPLRKNMYVSHDRVMKLRTLLENHSSVSGLTSEEKDPEEFLNSLVAQMLRAEPFLKLNSGQEAYYYQLFVEKDERLEFPSVQNLFEQSFLASDIKLKEVPSCLIIQMPRFGKSFKMYPRILPSPVLDVTDVIDDSPRQCFCCGKLATFECKTCLKPEGLESTSYCEACLKDRAHAHPECRSKKHDYRPLSIPDDFVGFQDTSIPRLYMELFAVVCIETSHYVSFVKCGDGPDAPWCFFDSMADRNGEQNGFNIPEVSHVSGLPYWLTEESASLFSKKTDRELPEHAKRLLCDAYMCMYRSSDVMMYR